MSLRILHTADNHIGLSFNQYPEAARERLIEERFVSLERIWVSRLVWAIRRGMVVCSGNRATL